MKPPTQQCWKHRFLNRLLLCCLVAGTGLTIERTTISNLDGNLLKCSSALRRNAEQRKSAPPELDEAAEEQAGQKPAARFREDGRCGQFYPAPAASPGECDPTDLVYHCCSGSGWCGASDEHCHCSDCVDYSKHAEALEAAAQREAILVEYDPAMGHTGDAPTPFPPTMFVGGGRLD